MSAKETALSLLQDQGVLKIPDYMRATEPSVMGGGLQGGGGRNRIGLKGSRFRLIEAGDEVAVKDENHLDVVVVTANPHISRMFYKGVYDPAVKTAPTCFSPDGVTPHASVQEKQSEKCNGCRQNVKGSRVTDSGAKTRACSFSKRLVVALDGDDTETMYQLDLKSMSIFGDGVSAKGLYTLAGYNKLLHNKGIRVEAVVTRLSFDTTISVPKVYFTPVRFLEEAEFKDIMKLSKSPEAREMATIDAVTIQPDNPDVPVEAKVAPVKVVKAAPEKVVKAAPKKQVAEEEVPEAKAEAVPETEDVPIENDDALAAALRSLTQ